MIAARHISVDIPGRRLLDLVSVSIDVGEVLAVVGPNGAGKSTLLNVLSGDRQPSSGDVTLDGRSLVGWSASQLARARAVLPQHDALRFPLAVWEVVRLGRAPWRGARDARRDESAVFKAMKMAGVASLADRTYTTLSGGERQRVQLARVLAQLEPGTGAGRFLLLDEPIASLDLSQQYHLLGLVRAVARQGVGVMVVLHDLNLAAQHADRVLLLHHGRVADQGHPERVFTARRVREVFGLAVRVLPHPCLSCPLLVPEAPGAGARGLASAATTPLVPITPHLH